MIARDGAVHSATEVATVCTADPRVPVAPIFQFEDSSTLALCLDGLPSARPAY